MQNLAELMAFYESYHTKHITKLTHFIGVPLIILAIQILFSSLYVPVINLPISVIVLILLSIYYFGLNFSLATIFLIFAIPLTLLAAVISQGEFNWTTILISIGLFGLGWVLQLIGHYFEQKRPALLANLFQIWVAPIFLVAEACFALGFYQNLQTEVLRRAQLTGYNQHNRK